MTFGTFGTCGRDRVLVSSRPQGKMVDYITFSTEYWRIELDTEIFIHYSTINLTIHDIIIVCLYM